jgi:hypothetical protein
MALPFLFGPAGQEVYDEKFEANIIDMKLFSGSNRKELKLSLFV